MSECVRCKNKIVITQKDYDDLCELVKGYVASDFIICWTLSSDSKNHPMFKRWKRLKRRLNTISETQMIG